MIDVKKDAWKSSMSTPHRGDEPSGQGSKRGLTPTRHAPLHIAGYKEDLQ
jgi:hypothetical protein